MMALMVSFAVQAKSFFLKGETFCALGEYNIVEAPVSFVLNGDELDTYIISYENSSKTVKVAVKKEDDCCRYIVLSDDLSVQYICKKDYFGVSLHKDDFIKLGLESNRDMIDLNGYHHQRIITPNSIKLKNCLSLIASYYPMIVKDYEKVFACKWYLPKQKLVNFCLGLLKRGEKTSLGVSSLFYGRQ